MISVGIAQPWGNTTGQGATVPSAGSAGMQPARTPAVATSSAARRPSPQTARANAFVRTHLGRAEALGRSLARDTGNPDALARVLDRGLATLADPAYLAGQRLVAPGIGPLHGVRRPLLDAIDHAFAHATDDTSTDLLLRVAARLVRDERQEPRWLAMGLLERTIGRDPERSWQLIRLAAREAGDWIAVDTLARPVAIGILNEPFRWAELEQLAFSPSRWERRLIGSAVATIPHVGQAGRQAAIARHSLPLLAQLMGDAEPDVQKAIGWAYRSLLRVDALAVEAALRTEATIAAQWQDGHRAWVIRDTLAKLPPTAAAELRAGLTGLRRRAGTPATSSAARTAAAFGVLPDPAAHPQPPLF